MYQHDGAVVSTVLTCPGHGFSLGTLASSKGRHARLIGVLTGHLCIQLSTYNRWDSLQPPLQT